MSSRPCGPRLCARSSASRVKPARSRDALRGDVARRREQIDPLEPQAAEPPGAGERHGTRRVAGAARVGRQPVSDLAAQVLPGEPQDRDRAEQSAEVVARHDRERGRRAGVQGRVTFEQVGLGVDLAVVLRHSGPASDLRVLAGTHDRVDILVAPGTQRGRAVDERVIGEHDLTRRLPHARRPLRGA